MNIQQELVTLEQKYRKLLKDNPEIHDIDFLIKEIPLEDFKAFTKANKMKVDYSENEKALRSVYYLDKFLGPVHLLTKKVTPVKPIIPEYVEFNEESHYAAAKQMVTEHAQSFRH